MTKKTWDNILSLSVRRDSIERIHSYDSDPKVFRYVHFEPLLELGLVDRGLELDDRADERLDAWCSFVDDIRFDFHGEHVLSAVIANEEISANASKAIREFCNAIADYRSDVRTIEHKIDVSPESARNYLYLIPAFGRHSHHVSIDADTGFVNVGFRSRHKELLTALVTSKGEVHYSFVGRGRKLVKISGTAKIKDKRDYISFKKILRMLWAV